jgi:tyrosyl-tRNA synthetase
MYGRTLSIPDSALDTWFELLAIERPAGELGPRDLTRALARGIVARFHGAGAAAAAEAHFDRLFVEHRPPEEIEEAVVRAQDGVLHLPAVIEEVFGRSRSDARRLLAQGGVKLDGEPVPADQLDMDAGRLDGAVLQIGKRQFRRLRLG